MQPLWLRYLRLWSAALEARLEIALTRWGCRMLHFLLIVAAMGIALLLATAGLIAWIVGTSEWAIAFIGAAGFWLTLGVLFWVLGRRILYALLTPRSALYRLRLAQAGLRLIETKLATASPSSLALSPFRWLSQIAGRWLWYTLRRWLPFL